MLAPASIAAGTMGLTFLIADLAHALDARPMPPGWAIPELCAGALQLVFGVSSFALAERSYLAELYVAWGVLGVAIGGWHVGHAIASLLSSRDPPATPVEVSVAPLVMPTSGGGVLGVTGRF